ncbi:putative membrane protein [Paenibacillus sp. SORGH_AS306]|uniref:hypothetical protein n=1 Tax=unclassified Paenibacillus TaxID=185978 RepID=UPI00278A543A|nr:MULTISPECIES: hypothetical protein [unclassified Paenibacillus]MDQ1233029.1 putative membrane protein [Paenibacillus sp. SORGH_AS_0306]MDR6110073.1 putative membrane protein [Paenibacillus sp. SORGH_AS_0338]
MALGIIMIIIGIPFLLVWGIMSIGIFIPDPSGASIPMGSLWGSWIIVSLFTFLPGFLLVYFGVKQIKRHNRKIQAQKDWYARQNEIHNERQQQHQNHSSGSIHTIDREDMQHIPHRQPNPNHHSNTTTSYSSTTTTTSNMNGNSTTTTDYKIFNPLDPKTAPYTSWQQQQRNQQMNPSPTPPPTPNLQPKKVDCSGCGAIYTIAPHETKDCEYCGNTVVYE